MRISRVGLTNFKGITAAFDLHPVTIITGPNGSGKTAITTAIRLGLAGQLPGLGKKAQSLYRLATNPEAAGFMTVTLRTDPAGVISHEWERNAKGSVSYAGSIPPDCLWTEAMLDFHTFLNLPGADQAREMFARCKTDATPAQFLDDELETVTGSNSEVARGEVAAIRDDLGRSKDCDLPLGRWIEGAEAWLKARVSESLVAEKNASAAMRALAGNQPDKQTGFSPEALAAANKALDEAQAGIAANLNAWRKYERDLAKHKTSVEAKETALNTELKRAFHAAAFVMQEIEQLKKQEACPTCGADGAGWRDKHIILLQNRIVSINTEHERMMKVLQAREVAPKPSKPEETSKAQMDRIAELQAEVNRLNALAAQDAKRADWRRSMNIAEDKASRATVSLAVAKECLKRLQAWRDKLTADGIQGVLDVANKFTAGILDAPLAWNSERGEFGRRTGKGWVALAVFSGFEEQVAFAALSVALASETKIKVVIMDELGRMTDRNKTAVVNRMAALIKDGVIDQFIGIDVAAVRGVYEPREGLGFITLGQ